MGIYTYKSAGPPPPLGVPRAGVRGSVRCALAWELVGRPGAGVLCRRGRGWGQGDQLTPGTGLGSLVSVWERVTLTLWRNRCEGGGAGSGAGSGLVLAIGWRSCILSLGALFGELVSTTERVDDGRIQ